MPRPPDLQNEAGTIRIWLFRPTPETLEKHPDWAAGLVTWLVEGDLGVFSPMCTHWWGSMIHLRDLPGQSKPPTLQIPDATHEIMWFAINPEVKQDWVAFYDEAMVEGRDNEDGHGPTGFFLTPAEMVHQFAGLTDEAATEVAEAFTRAVLAGENLDSPVQYGPLITAAWRTAWHSILDGTAEHYRTGHWPLTEEGRA